EAGRGRRRDRDAAFLLLLHPVHRRRTVVHLANLVTDAGVEQDALRGRGLARIDVGHDAEVAVALDGSGTCHSDFPCRAFRPKMRAAIRAALSMIEESA